MLVAVAIDNLSTDVGWWVIREVTRSPESPPPDSEHEYRQMTCCIAETLEV